MPKPELPPIDEMLAVLKKAYESGAKWESLAPHDIFYTRVHQCCDDVTTVTRMAQCKIEELAYLRNRSYQRIICNLPALYWDALNILQDDQQLEKLTATKEKIEQRQHPEFIRDNQVINAYFKPSQSSQ